MHKNENKLINAAKSNKFEDLRKIFDKIDKAKAKRKLKENIDIDAKDSIGMTAIHFSAKNGNVEMMVYLVSRGACIESIDQNGWRPISYACANNHLNAVKTLIQWKSNVNKFSLMEENSPLHIAAGFGYIDIVKLLMENGAVVYQQNKKKQTAMDVACENNHYGVVNVLLAASSKLIEDTTDKNNFQNNYSQSISSSLSKSSLFIKSPSINSSHHIISRMKSDFPGIGNLDYKRRTIGSQNQLCITPEKPKPKKSGSLNTVYLNDNSCDDSSKKVDQNENSDIHNNKSNISEIEVSLPYPSKFSTSEKLKIKSPLLATKNWKVDKKVRRNNPSIIDSYSDQYSAQFLYPTECRTSPSIIRVPTENFSFSSRPLSSSCKFEKDDLTKQTSNSCINNPNMVYFLKPHSSLSSNSPTDPHYASASHFGKSQSFRRCFGSESDIDSPNRKTNRDDTLKSKTKIKTPYVKSPSLHEYALSKNENNNPIENNAINKDEEYTCDKWIKNLGLFRIWDTLFKEGFDSFLALSLATNDELLLLCDNNIEDWDKLKNNLELLKLASLTQLKFSTKISDLLVQLGLECYINNFTNNGYIFTHQTFDFEEINLNKLQIFRIGHRKLLLKCFSIIHNTESNNSEKSNSPLSINDSPSKCIFDESKNFLNNRNSPIFKNEDENEIDSESFEFPEKNNIQKLNNITEMNHFPVIMSKKPPPPVPNRSSSIFENSNNLTLDDILSPSVREKTKKNTNRALSVNIKPADPSSLDDIVNLLQNLGKELDQELNKVSV